MPEHARHRGAARVVAASFIATSIGASRELSDGGAHSSEFRNASRGGGGHSHGGAGHGGALHFGHGYGHGGNLGGHRHNASAGGGHRTRRLLPFCVDGEPGHVTLTDVCKSVQGAATWLCAGALRIQRASCAELASDEYMRSAVLQVGLTPDGRGAAIYGTNASQHMVQVHGKAARLKVGLWQSPAQIAAALIHVGSSVEVRRYIEVGVYSAWTCCFVSAYLRRVSTLGSFRGLAVDITSVALAAGTRALLPHLNVTFQYRSKLTMPPIGSGAKLKEPWDFCFLDGDHRLDGVKRDYLTFAPSCQYMMFHDIQDVSTLHLGNFSGGVPMFWARLKAHTRRGRTREFTQTPAEVAVPSFGLGVLGPNERRTCEPDVPEETWQPRWEFGDGTATTAWRELCRLNRTRLCNLGADALAKANSKKAL